MTVKILKNIFLLILSSLLALVMGESVLRFVSPVYDYRDRSLLFSSPVFKIYSGGSVRYLPDSTIREAAVYNGTIEYDVTYHTNSLGFIDNKNYSREKRAGVEYYAFVGDSFTAGVNGGKPWVPSLRDNSRQAEVYNFGVAATGFAHFHSLLRDMKGRVPITQIIVVAITDDFFRGMWHPVVAGDVLSFCSEAAPHTACVPVPVASIVPLDARSDELLSLSKAGYKKIRSKVDEINSTRGWRSHLESALYDDSVIYYYTKILLDTYRRSHDPTDIEYAIDALQKIKSEFPAAKVHLIHLPQKYEVRTKQYQIDIADQVSAAGVKYFPALNACSWTLDMYFPRDGHPNSLGYDNIAKCVSDYLFASRSDTKN